MPSNSSPALSPVYSRATPYVTPVLIGINVLVFLAMVLSGASFVTPSAHDLVPWGANFGPLTTSGQWWRLFTACFLHFGIIHLAVNMFVLWQVGPFTERLFGSVRYLVLYLLAGIGGNVAGLFFHPYTVGAGASGAIFGVYGGLLGFLLVQRGVVPSASAIKIAQSAGLFILYNVVYGLARPETDLVAHGAGLVTGFAAGCLLALPIDSAPRRSLTRSAAVVLGFAILGSLAVTRLPRSNPSQIEWARDTMTGPRITVGHNDQLVYRGTATPAQAQGVAQMLSDLGFFSAPDIVLLFDKTPTGSYLAIPLRGSEGASTNLLGRFIGSKPAGAAAEKQVPPWDDPATIASVRLMGPRLASAAGGLPFSIRLLDSNHELRSEIPIDTTDIAVGKHDRISYSGDATAQEATALGKALQSSGFFTDRGSHVFLAKAGGVAEISFLVNEGSWDNPGAVDYVKRISREVAPSVGGPPLRVHLLDSARRPRKELTID